jgi:hypothetical protein
MRRKNLSPLPAEYAAQAGMAISVDPRLGADYVFETQSCVARMTGGRAAGESDEPNTPAIDYQGYRIWPTPYRTEGQYQTAGIIEKNFPDGPKQHRFVRADTHQNRDDAVAFAILKAKQIIDLQGDRTFT